LVTRRRNKAFPDYFSSFLHQYIFSITDGGAGHRSVTIAASERVTEGDERVSRIYHDFDKIAFFLGFVSQPHSNDESASLKRRGNQWFPVQIDLPNYANVKKTEPISSNDGSLIFLSLIMSSIRNTAKPQTRVEACDTVLALSERISDEAKLDRVLPYLVTLLSDAVAIVRATALRTITQLVLPPPAFLTS
jgi:phosphoinositide-3-kinase, regulatory subunit 4